MNFALFIASLHSSYTSPSLAFGPAGHRTIGAIADVQLRKTDMYPTITGIIHGISLERASILPDQIKDWDKKRPASRSAISEASLMDIPLELKRDLFEFWKANPHVNYTKMNPPSHHIFRFTDVPINGPLSYVDARAGTNQFDIAHIASQDLPSFGQDDSTARKAVGFSL